MFDIGGAKTEVPMTSVVQVKQYAERALTATTTDDKLDEIARALIELTRHLDGVHGALSRKMESL